MDLRRPLLPGALPPECDVPHLWPGHGQRHRARVPGGLRARDADRPDPGVQRSAAVDELTPPVLLLARRHRGRRRPLPSHGGRPPPGRHPPGGGPTRAGPHGDVR
ncbi:hypothetical protein EAO69_24140 [Streptomyces sp. me109]|nr:hypothetical protein EAO69_24140 [Streptomyces sp. me109]